MSGHLFGWFGDTEGAGAWKKLVCNAEGKLIIDPSEIFENNPTDNEHGKAPDSDWAHDHKADASAHHADNLIIPYPNFIWRQDFLPTYYDYGLSISYVHGAFGWPGYGVVMNFRGIETPALWGAGQIFFPINYFGDATDCFIRYSDYATNDWTAWRTLAPDVDGMIETHRAKPSDHHAKYTDLEAQTACKLNGTLYWSCSGLHFDAINPAVNNVYKMVNGSIKAESDGITFLANVNLPNGATVSGVIVYGNAGAEAETFHLMRIKISDGTYSEMAAQNIGTEDITITNPVIDNCLYAYYFYTSSLDTNDAILGAEITYTL